MYVDAERSVYNICMTSCAKNEKKNNPQQTASTEQEVAACQNRFNEWAAQGMENEAISFSLNLVHIPV